MRVSRRTMLAVGGSLVAVLSGAAVWKSRSVTSATRPGGARHLMEQAVDYNGWMLTVADRKKLLGAESHAATP